MCLGRTLSNTYYTTGGKKEIVIKEKPQKCVSIPNVLACLSKPERTYWSLLSLKNLQLKYEAWEIIPGDYTGKTFARTKWDLWWHRILQPILTWRYLHLIKMRIWFLKTTANLSYDQKMLTLPMTAQTCDGIHIAIFTALWSPHLGIFSMSKIFRT